MLKRQAFSIAGAAAAALLVLSAGVQAAQRVEKIEKPAPASERIAALQVRVQDRQTNKVRFVELGVPVQIEPGQELRLSLVGADHQDDNAGRAGDVGVQARFFEASNRGAIDLGNSGGNWVIVKGLRTRGSVAEVGYEVQGSYRMDAALRTGRIPLELVDNSPADGGHGGDHGNTGDTDRRRRAEDLVTLLYRGILQRDVRDTSDRAFRDDVDRVFRDGYNGVRQVARDLADDAERSGVFSRREPREALGDLYRTLLGRTDDDRALWSRDGGFRDNIRLLEDRDGLRRVVDVIVGSEEFQRNQNLDSYGFMRPYRR